MAKTLTAEERVILDESKRVLAGETQITPAFLTDKQVGSRYLETLWTAEHLKGVKSILDVGFSLASLEYLGMLLAAKESGASIHGVDIIDPEKVRSRYPEEWLNAIFEVPVTIGDVRTLALPENAYDAVTCISTIEHIGYDAPSTTVGGSAFERVSSEAEARTDRQPSADRDVLAAFHNVLKPGGTALITTPMGSGGPVILRDSLGLYCVEWEYEAESWKGIRDARGFSVDEELFFRNTSSGWKQVSGPADLSDVHEEMIPGQGFGVALIALRKEA